MTEIELFLALEQHIIQNSTIRTGSAIKTEFICETMICDEYNKMYRRVKTSNLDASIELIDDVYQVAYRKGNKYVLLDVVKSLKKKHSIPQTMIIREKVNQLAKILA